METEVQLDGVENAGLIIHYGPDAYVCLGIKSDGSIYRGYRAGHRKRPITRRHRYNGDRVRLRLVNDDNDLRCYFLNGEGKWVVVQASLDITGFNDSSFYGNSSMRPGLYTIGKGKARFSYFRYTPLGDN